MTSMAFWMRVGIVIAVLFLIDLYVYQGVKFLASRVSSLTLQRIFRVSYWVVSGGYLFTSILLFAIPGFLNGPSNRLVQLVFGGLVLFYLPKLVLLVFLLIDDLRIGFQFVIIRIQDWFSSSTPSTDSTTYQSISRSQFLTQAGVLLASIPFASVAYGLVRGKYNYKVRKETIFIKNLPSAFEGFRIAQVSDIHSGSFDDPEAVEQGIDLVNAQGADLIVFTGDLVNNKAEEVEPYIPIFKKLAAPHGVYSIFGNHDYGDYVSNWKPGEKAENLRRLAAIQAEMGWRLLLNENVEICQENDFISLIGVENWSAKARFPKYGRLDEAMERVRPDSTQILLSHDPSHWEAEVLSKYPGINLMLAGHTHGMQFGVEIAGIHWSPIQYMYKQWAGLYQEKHQYLYVNRGFGFIGFPGRVGIMPEITVLELKRLIG